MIAFLKRLRRAWREFRLVPRPKLWPPGRELEASYQRWLKETGVTPPQYKREEET